MKTDVYEIINNRIFELIEKEKCLPWQKPWKDGFAKNLISKKPYKGINAMNLNMLPYKNNYYVTYNQAVKLGGKVRKGERGFPVVFWKFFEIQEKETEKKKTIPLLRYFTVFNVEQCEGITENKIPIDEEKPFNPIESCENIIKGYTTKPPIEFHGNHASYCPSTDKINMPKKEMFNDEIGYYSTLFHEAIHSTGHKSRLNREELNKIAAFGSDSYSKEELTAEMGSAYLCGIAGIDNVHEYNQAAGYIASWLKVLKNNKTWLVSAAGKAQKAVDYITGKATE